MSSLLPSVTPERAHRLIDGFARLRVLVIGDAMLDRFILGRVSRLSPEAPVPVVQFDHEVTRLGGAANVAHNVTALRGESMLVAVTGQDDAAATLTEACRGAEIAPTFVSDPLRRTTTKVRIATERNQQVARIDYETDAAITGDCEGLVIAAVRQLSQGADVIVVSDYCKGVVTDAVARAAIDAATQRGIPVLVDPKIPHMAYYRGASLVTPNASEAETATHRIIRDEGAARDAARAFRARVECSAVLITRGDQGMWLCSDQAEGALPAIAREVADVTGAGDTVIATIAMALASGASLPEAAWLANHAAARSVARFGPATVSPSELRAAAETAR
jgi:D-beta-D-heptose 7-phosphate kinase/D-beta-D-heptose 1-phosphate adenosyltransferase